jgi:hypothetical protein
MTDTKKKLLAYRIQGSAAERMFEEFEDAASESTIENPEEGVIAVINWSPTPTKELLAVLKATKQLIKDKDIDELKIFIDEVNEAGKTFMAIALELSDYVNMLGASDED